MRINLAVALLCIGALSACASSGRQIDQQAVQSIETGVTTKQQLVDRLGPPVTQTFTQDGALSLSWFYVHVGFAGMSGQQQMLTVLFDQDEKVRRYSFTDNPNTGARFGK